MACDERTKCLACSHDGKMTVNCRWSMERACHLELVVFRIDLVNGQQQTHSRYRGRWQMLEFGLASKRETNERRGSAGRGQEIGRQFHFGLVQVLLSTDGSTSLKNGIEPRGSTGSTFFNICLEANSLILLFSSKKKWLRYTEGIIGERDGGKKMFLFAHFRSH
jgi:hypothetical protein